MLGEPPRFVLASASAGRLRLLQAAGIEPEVIVSGVDESGVGAPDAASLVRALAEAKAASVATSMSGSGGGTALVLGCDSALDFDGEVLGKPADAAEAERRWHRMAGRAGVLHTGHCLVATETGTRFSEVSSTIVRFGRPTTTELAAYIASGEPLRVAGAFTIDGLGGPFVDGIEGDPGTVIGLSLPVLRRLLAQHGVSITALWRAS
ncbi:MAG: septum formation inhibitor Maf [Geodermatophilaceae bacterium]|nr:septum formation inhibitor Maf [Geodermatophilaceae bacterium]